MRIISIYLSYISGRIFYSFVVLIIVACCYFLTIPYIEFDHYLVLNPFYQITSQLPTWLVIINFTTLTLTILVIVFYILTVYYILNKRRTRRIHRKYDSLLVGYLFDFLYDETSSNYERRKKLKRIKRCLRSDITKRIFLNRLRRVHLQMNGEIKDRNFNLLKALQYTSFLRAYLKSPHLRHKLFALRIISDFHLQGYEGYIYKLTKSSNRIVSSEALVTLIALYIYDDHLFLVDFIRPLSIWDINTIVNKVQQQQHNKRFNYKKLILSEVPEISVVGIILARIDKQKQLKSVIKKKIDSSVALVSEQAFLTFVSFAAEPDDFDYIIYRFEAATEHVKLHILKALSTLKNNNDKIKFLNWVVANKSIIYKIEAIKSLLDVDYDYYNVKFRDSASDSVKNAMLHVENIHY